MTTYLHATHRNNTTSTVFEFIGEYTDDVRLTPAGWRIRARTLTPKQVEFRPFAPPPAP
jgi:hypothetical protein